MLISCIRRQLRRKIMSEQIQILRTHLGLASGFRWCPWCIVEAPCSSGGVGDGEPTRTPALQTERAGSTSTDTPHSPVLCTTHTHNNEKTTSGLSFAYTTPQSPTNPDSEQGVGAANVLTRDRSSRRLRIGSPWQESNPEAVCTRVVNIFQEQSSSQNCTILIRCLENVFADIRRWEPASGSYIWRNGKRLGTSELQQLLHTILVGSFAKLH